VNLTKICSSFGFADVTQNVDTHSSKNLRLQQTIEAAIPPTGWELVVLRCFCDSPGTGCA